MTGHKLPLRSDPGGDIVVPPLTNGCPIVRLLACRQHPYRVPTHEDIVTPMDLPLVEVEVLPGHDHPCAHITRGHEHMPRLLEWWPPDAHRPEVEEMGTLRAEVRRLRASANMHRQKGFREGMEMAASETVRANAVADEMRWKAELLEHRFGAEWVCRWSIYDWDWRTMLERDDDPSRLY